MSPPAPTIAVVDDDPRVLESLESLLESAGYTVRAFPSAERLLAAGLCGIGCIVTDIGLLGMDGIELRHAVKRLQPQLPVFLLTGRHEIADRWREEVTADTGLFRKPFHGPTVLTAISNALRPKPGS